MFIESPFKYLLVHLYYFYLGDEWYDEAIWIGGYQMYSNNSHYWLDGEALNVGELSWYGTADPKYNEDTHLILYQCGQWVMADYNNPGSEFRILCEI